MPEAPLTEAPIFMLGIQRGGTNQILNILRSHPDTFWPQGEFHEVFRSRGPRREGIARALAKWRRYAPIRLRAGDILDPDTLRAGAGLRPRAGPIGRAVAAGLAGSARSNRPAVAAYKQALRDHGFIDATPDPSRMLCKVMNYNLGFARDLAALYPAARFVGVIRDGRAVCEGHIARGAPVAAASAVYSFVGQQLIDLEAAGLPLRTWRFEDLLQDPGAVAAEIYAFCGLDRNAISGVRLQDKERVIGAAGALVGVSKADLFYRFEDIGRHMRSDANAGALSRLPAAARAEIEARCAPVLRHFRYAPQEDDPPA